MRKLASIQIIKDLKPIEGRDRIELAEILGWNVIVEKGVFKPGDKVVYIEVDSIIPIKPEFEFLRARCFSPKWDGFRIRTMKMGLVYSQGIVFGLNILPNGNYNIGDDVTDIIGIKQMEEEENTGTPKPKKWFLIRYLYKWGILKQSKNIHNKFPEFLSKTDETRCVNMDSFISTNKYGEISIKELLLKNDKDNLKVLSYNFKNKQEEYDDIIEINVSENDDNWYYIETETGKKTIITEDHLIWLPTLKCYRQVKDLNINDEVYISDYTKTENKMS